MRRPPARSPRAIAIGVAVLVVVAVAAVLVSRAGGSAAGDPAAAASATVSSGQQCAAVSADAPGAKASGLPVKPLCALPAETAQTWLLIKKGGPFASSQDGTTFLNAERLLPIKERGYYREYTVPTPGSRDRGARRLIAGRGQELYFTADHYVSFVVVDVNAGVPAGVPTGGG